MTNLLKETVLRYGSNFVAAYKRTSKASEEDKLSSGLTASGQTDVVLGISSPKEYVVFQTTNIAKNTRKTFNLSRWGAELAFESLYVENPEADFFYIEVYSATGEKIINQYISKNMTQIQFPANPIPTNIVIKIFAITDITFLRLVASPCKILETFFAEEDYPTANPNKP